MSKFLVRLNYMGIPIEPNEIDRILAAGADVTVSADTSSPLKWEYGVLESFFALPIRCLPREVLERYVEVSKKEIYIPISPSSGKLFERLLSPFKSAKRCYCFGEYIAAIEMCAHVGEMLAILLWQISPIKFNGFPINKEFEKNLWGREFEKLGQEKRVQILKTFGVASKEHVTIFNSLRHIRTRYFHLWSSTRENVKNDALDCFNKTAVLVKEILQFEISKQDPSRLTVNPLLVEYLRKNKEHELDNLPG